MSRKEDLFALQKGIKKRGNPLGVTLLHFLQLDWPDSDVVITRMSDFLASSGLEPEEIEFITCSIIECSLKAYGETLFSAERNKKNQDPYRVAIFIDQLIVELTQHLAEGIGAESQLTASIDEEGENVTWGQSQTLTAEDKLKLRVFMYQVFVKDELKQALRRSDYEQTLLDGAFHSEHTDIGSNDSCAR